jgi:putative ABC transport system permease protein
MNSISFLETLWQDLRYSARLLRLNPGFTAVAILSLSLGIGANTAIFQLLDAVRLRTLPVKSPEELAEVKISPHNWSHGNFTSRHPETTDALWEQIRDRQEAFSAISAWSDDSFNLAPGGPARYAQGLWVSGDFFRVLGVHPVLGRVFTPADDRRGCGTAGAVISYPFWHREFGGDNSVIGRKLTLEGHPFEVIGVTPADFSGIEVGRSFDVAVPICAEPAVKGEQARLDRRDAWWLAIIGRLKPGWRQAQAAAHVRSISGSVLEATIPPSYRAEEVKRYMEYRFSAFPAGTGFSSLREDYEQPLWMLLAIAGLVLLIACANLANLMLARASAREREIAVRLAMGASRGRLIRQLLAESVLLAVAGAALGAMLSQWLSQFLVSFLTTENSPLFVDLHPDWRVLAFTAGLAILTCIVFGLTPAMRATKTSPGAVLKTSGRGMTAGRERFGLRRMLVVSQVALSLVLLVGALLFVRSLRNLLTLDAGFRQDGILITQVDLSRLKLPKDRRQPFKNELLDRIRAIPGVDSAASASLIPANGDFWNDTIWIEGSQAPKGTSFFSRITASYFKTLGTPMLAGRDFNEYDTPASPKVAIVNDAFIRKFLNGASPMGRTFHLQVGPGEPAQSYEIVGVVRNTKYGDLREQFRAIAFVADRQSTEPDQFSQIFIHSSATLAALVSAVKGTVAEINPDIGIDFHVFKTEIWNSLLRDRLMATLAGFFGALAVLLATIGLYGVISYMVLRRTNEIGIRMALGAARRDVLTMILREALTLVAVGAPIGAGLALVGGIAARAMLFGLKPYDPATLVMAVAILAAVAVTASYLPARRAARLEPMMALRDE